MTSVGVGIGSLLLVRENEVLQLRLAPRRNLIGRGVVPSADRHAVDNHRFGRRRRPRRVHRRRRHRRLELRRDQVLEPRARPAVGRRSPLRPGGGRLRSVGRGAAAAAPARSGARPGGSVWTARLRDRVRVPVLGAAGRAGRDRRGRDGGRPAADAAARGRAPDGAAERPRGRGRGDRPRRLGADLLPVRLGRLRLAFVCPARRRGLGGGGVRRDLEARAAR